LIHAAQLVNAEARRAREANVRRVLEATARGGCEVVAGAKQGRRIATTAVRYCSGGRDVTTLCF
jgi:hypothetical protein